MPMPEAAAKMGRLYCLLLPSDHRAAHGIFYTPALLVGRLLDSAEAAGHDWTRGKVIDPSCGGGAFMVDAAARIVLALGPAAPAVVVADLHSATVVVADQSPDARARGFRTALAQVVVRLTGDPSAPDAADLAPLMRTAQRFVGEYFYAVDPPPEPRYQP